MKNYNSIMQFALLFVSSELMEGGKKKTTKTYMQWKSDAKKLIEKWAEILKETSGKNKRMTMMKAVLTQQ